MTKLAEVVEQKSDAPLHGVQSGRVEKRHSESQSDGQAKVRIKKAKYAMLLAYQGKNYFGMQIQKGHPTIEGELISAMHKLGWITEQMKEQPSLFHFQRAARTDRAVSAVRQICGMELPQRDDYAIIGVNELNTLLPEDIRVIIRFLIGSLQLTNAAFRIKKETIDEINHLLSIYKGTHNFFNYTSKREFDDRSCFRYILSFECGEPFLFHDDVRNEDVEFIQLTVKGQSFILHQIRKMVGMVIAVVRELQYKSYIQRTFESDRVDVPKAPGLGLLLERVHYDVYDRKHAKTHEPLTDWGPEVEARVKEVKFELITKEILISELRHQSMLQWLADLVRHDFCADPEAEELPKQTFLTMAAAKAAAEKMEVKEENVPSCEDGAKQEALEDGTTANVSSCGDTIKKEIQEDGTTVDIPPACTDAIKKEIQGDNVTVQSGQITEVFLGYVLFFSLPCISNPALANQSSIAERVC
ncbi:tRNA pseudouridine synthase A [Ancylostoma ceylanicum]|uniref:Pseudouridylate synthase 1 homolog n=1 Tax=Ancylostoma ceylanicum TaxID=53326 RepID=A0A0D6LGB2_9BILA|nr:tRNA pseudouridine synthase A [Ancylostoma ceylanicum]